jgi:hypothetical protein
MPLAIQFKYVSFMQFAPAQSHYTHLMIEWHEGNDVTIDDTTPVLERPRAVPLAAGCFGSMDGEAKIAHDVAIDPDLFALLFSQPCMCHRPPGYHCTLTSARELYFPAT